MNQYCMQCGQPAVQKTESLVLCTDGHENWINPPIGAIAFVMGEQGVLFGVRSKHPGSGKLGLPGGIIEMGESAEAAIIRESREELGIEIEIIELLKTYATTYAGRQILNLVYIVRMTSEKIIPGDEMNAGAPIWRSLDNLPGEDESAFEWYQSAFADLLEWHGRKQLV